MAVFEKYTQEELEVMWGHEDEISDQLLALNFTEKEIRKGWLYLRYLCGTGNDLWVVPTETSITTEEMMELIRRIYHEDCWYDEITPRATKMLENRGIDFSNPETKFPKNWK